MSDRGGVLALSGGIGGAKLALGLDRVLRARPAHRGGEHRR